LYILMFRFFVPVWLCL